MKKFLVGLIIGGLIGAVVMFNMPDSITQKEINNETLNAILWMQTSAEYRALCYQAYNTALTHIKAASENIKSDDKTLAIILDCDETVIDNTRVDAALLDSNIADQLSLLREWRNKGIAGAMPGAYEFLNAVDSLGAEIFYVTNRDEEYKAGIIQNMKNLNFPQIDDKHVLCKTEAGGKEARFERIESQYNVILYLGDTAHDFPTGSYHKSMSERNKITDDNRQFYGVKYIVLPNPVYGDWLDEFGGKIPEEIHSKKMNALNIWDGK